jgi:hypothetical protein
MTKLYFREKFFFWLVFTFLYPNHVFCTRRDILYDIASRFVAFRAGYCRAYGLVSFGAFHELGGVL